MKQRSQASSSYFAIDCGTTNTSVFLLSGGKIVDSVQQPVGVRNTSIGLDRSPLYEALRASLDKLARKPPSEPRFILAAGMITSSLGLWEVPHVVAPAGIETLSKHVQRKAFPQISPLPFFFVPGVRVNSPPCTLENVHSTDIIRGEETEIIGHVIRCRPRRSWLFLHLGSHTKAIVVDARGRITRSTTTLSGECLYALRTQTILAKRLGRPPGSNLEKRFFYQGALCAQHHGFLRTLFMIRLLEENRSYPTKALYSFLLGAILFNDLKAFHNRRILNRQTGLVVLSGHPTLSKAWRLMLKKRGLRTEELGQGERVAGFLTGLQAIVFSSKPFQRLLSRP